MLKTKIDYVNPYEIVGDYQYELARGLDVNTCKPLTDAQKNYRQGFIDAMEYCKSFYNNELIKDDVVCRVLGVKDDD